MAEMQSKMGQTVQQDRENRELQQKAQEIVDVFPILNPESKSYDDGLATKVLELT